MTEEKLKKIFRPVALMEGISLLLLFFMAMPMKYIYAQPQYVKIVGWIHGILFIAFIALLMIARVWFKWPIKRTFIFLIAAILPFGAFYVDRKYLN